jgi:hypothetical protein
MSSSDEGSSKPKHASMAKASAAREGPESKSSSPSEQTPPVGLIAITIDTATGQLAKVEKVDSAGARHELTSEEKARLRQQSADTIEVLIEQAFEAGIACVLGARADERDSSESEDDARLRELLLRPLIEQSPVARLMAREVLGRAILGTLTQRALGSGDVAPESSRT